MHITTAHGKINVLTITESDLTNEIKSMIEYATAINSSFEIAKNLALIKKTFTDSDVIWKKNISEDAFTEISKALPFLEHAYIHLSNKPAFTAIPQHV